MAAQYQLIIRAGPNTGKAYMLEGSEITIGREASNTISINDAEVSRTHSRLVWQENTYVIEDLGSTNGTFVNGQRVSTALPLRPGETVGLGENIVLLFEVVADPNATMVSASKRAASAKRVKPAAPAATPDYAGQVPAGPPVKESIPGAKKPVPSKLILIIVIAVVACLIISCVAVLFYLDAGSGERWCQYLPWLINIFFPGSCP